VRLMCSLLEVCAARAQKAADKALDFAGTLKLGEDASKGAFECQ